MPEPLPANPSLSVFKSQAKKAVRQHRQGHRRICELIAELHPDFRGLSYEEVVKKPFSLHDAQLCLARYYGFSSWPRLKRKVETLTNPTLHKAWQEAIDSNDADRVARLLQEQPLLFDQRLIRHPRNGTSYVLNPLLVACMNDCLPIAKLLVHAGADVNERNPDGGSVALGPGCGPELADYLLDHGADINAVSYRGSTPLMLAAYSGETDLVVHLLKRGADVTIAHPQEGMTSLHYATLCRPRLRGWKSDEGFSPERFRTIVHALIDAGADVNARCAVGVTTDAGLPMELHGETPLHFAAASRDSHIVDALLKSGANRRMKNTLGETPYDWADKLASKGL